MAKKETNETRTSIDALNDSLSGVEQKVQANKKYIVWAVVAVAVLVGAVLIYLYGIRQPGIQKANDEIGRADLQLVLGNDSIALQQYMAVANNHGYDAGNRAALQAAILLYKEGKYEEAIKYLDKASVSDQIIKAGAYSLKGDCYANLNKLNDALGCFEKAVKASDNNPSYTPFFMMKEARIYRELKDYSKEAATYQAILDEYPTYASEYGIDLQRYIERANAESK